MKITIELHSVQELKELADAISSVGKYGFYSPPVNYTSERTLDNQSKVTEYEPTMENTTLTSDTKFEVNDNNTSRTLDNTTKVIETQETIESPRTLDNQSEVTEDKPVMIEVNAENYKTILKAETILKADGTKNYKKVVSDEEIETIKKMQKGGMPLSKICRDLDLNYRTVYDRLNRPYRNRVDLKKNDSSEKVVERSAKERVLELWDGGVLSAVDIAEKLGMKYSHVAGIISRTYGKVEKRNIESTKTKRIEKRKEGNENILKILKDPNSPIKYSWEMHPPVKDEELSPEKQLEVVKMWNLNKHSLLEVVQATGVDIELCKRIIKNDKRIKR